MTDELCGNELAPLPFNLPRQTPAHLLHELHVPARLEPGKNQHVYQRH